MSTPRRADPELLLQHASWLRRLAYGLVHDAQQAEDLSQETWVRALERPPRDDEPLRGWLATVMRNLWRQTQRGDARRHTRERAAARSEALASTSDLIERVTTQRELVALVLDLDEPYRTTLLMRYFEELSPKRIARQLDTPVSTIKTRLARGLERLRQRLDAAHGGDGRTWLSVLAPIVSPPVSAPVTSPVSPRAPAASLPATTLSTTLLPLGALAVNLKLVLTVLVLVSGGLFWMTLDRDSEAAVPPLSEATLQTMEKAAKLEQARGPRWTEREDVAVASTTERRSLPARTTGAAPEPTARTFHGRVLDADSNPVANVAVVVKPGPRGEAQELLSGEGDDAAPLATTDAEGRFQWQGEDATGRALAVRSDAWTTALSGNGRDQTVIVVGPRLRLAGRVVDAAGMPLVATIEYGLPEGYRGRLNAVLDRSHSLAWRTESGPDGSFELPDVPAWRDARLLVSAPRHASLVAAAPMVDDLALLLTLERPVESGRVLAGVVLDVSGAPVEGATVSHGFDARTTDARGQFRFDLDVEPSFNATLGSFIEVDADRLQAVAPGLLPAFFVPDATPEGELLWPEFVTLRLGAEPLVIEGRVVDEAGAARAGAMVWIADPTFFGGRGDPARDRFPSITNLENEIMGAAPGWRSVLSDEDGRFLLEGLLPRAYTIEAMDPETLLRTAVENVDAGSGDLRLVLSSEASFAELRGTIVDRDGTPIPDVSIRPMCDAFRDRYRGRTLSTTHHTGETIVTNEAGAFRLRDVPRDLVYLRLDGEDIVPLEWGRHVTGGLGQMLDDPTDVRLVVERRCHFQIELSDPLEADALSLLDADGDSVTISEFLGNGRRDGPLHRLIDGRSSVLAAGDRATTLLLWKDDVEVRRAPIRLRPGETTVLRP